MAKDDDVRKAALAHLAFRASMAQRGDVALTAKDVAFALNVSPRHIYKLVSENKIPHVRIGSAVRFDATDIANWVSKMAAEHAPEE